MPVTSLPRLLYTVMQSWWPWITTADTNAPPLCPVSVSNKRPALHHASRTCEWCRPCCSENMQQHASSTCRVLHCCLLCPSRRAHWDSANISCCTYPQTRSASAGICGSSRNGLLTHVAVQHLQPTVPTASPARQLQFLYGRVCFGTAFAAGACGSEASCAPVQPVHQALCALLFHVHL